MALREKRTIQPDEAPGAKRILLVGSPNVGKSAIFNSLTGSYVTVSNYPGTTVDIAAGKLKIGPHHQFSVIDMPGMYSLRPITAEENVSRKLLFGERPDVVLHIVDAKNLERMLPMTFQLIETGLPVILVLNLYDELKARGMQLHIAHLEHDLGIPVVETVAVSGLGIDNLSSRIVEVIEDRYRYNTIEIQYPVNVEEKIAEICGHLREEYSVSKRTLATLLLARDQTVIEMVKKESGFGKIEDIIRETSDQDMLYAISQERQRITREIVTERVVLDEEKRRGAWKEKLSQIMVHPVWGIPILAAVLWFGVYKFVGEFGAGTLVDLIETNFETYVNPRVDVACRALFGSSVFFDLIAGEYGIITLGVRYAIAIIFPIVATFFIAFSIIEDTGYLPRLAMLVDRVFKKIGLSGRAIIPLTLGFGCDTMATIVTRTLESTKERVIATFLLSLVIPCSAQLGVLLGLMTGNPVMLLIWSVTIFTVFVFAGFLAKQLVKGEETGFFMELPPLRMPSFMNVFTKTYTRMIWYFKEVIPIFMLASVAIWFGKITGIFDLLVRVMAYPVKWAGIPEAASPAFLYGFFRRDFGAAGLFDLAKNGGLTGNGLLVSAVVLTLFVPCVAQFAVMWKERGKMTAIGMALFIFPFAFFVGFLLNVLLNVFGVRL
ncbi:MAG: ferrous iron transport protein B [Candidatus Omnitrophota bacterium]